MAGQIIATQTTTPATSRMNCQSDSVCYVLEGTCETCGEPYGHAVAGFGGLTFPWLCKCKQEAEEKEHEEKKEAERAKERARRIEKNRIAYVRSLPAIYKGSTLENYEIRTESTEAQKSTSYALRMSKRYAEIFQQNRANGTGLVYVGACGGGKTHLACAIGHAVIEQGYSVLYTRVGVLLRKIKDAQLGSLEDAIHPFTHCSLLILDDVGVEKETEWAMEQLNEIVDERVANLRPILVTTNLTEQQLESQVDGRILDRIITSDNYHRITIQCGSYRSRRRKT